MRRVIGFGLTRGAHPLCSTLDHLSVRGGEMKGKHGQYPDKWSSVEQGGCAPLVNPKPMTRRI